MRWNQSEAERRAREWLRLETKGKRGLSAYALVLTELLIEMDSMRAQMFKSDRRDTDELRGIESE